MSPIGRDPDTTIDKVPSNQNDDSALDPIDAYLRSHKEALHVSFSGDPSKTEGNPAVPNAATLNRMANTAQSEPADKVLKAINDETVKLEQDPIYQKFQQQLNKISSPENLDINYPAAEKVLKEQLSYLQTNYGKGGRVVIDCLRDLAKVSREQGNDEDAAKYDQQAIATAKNNFGPYHPRTLETITVSENNRLESDLEYQDLKAKRDGALPETPRTEAAFRKEENALRAELSYLEKNYGAESPALLKCLEDMAKCCAQQNKSGEAAAYYRQAVEITKKLYGPDSYYAGNQLAELARYEAADPGNKQSLIDATNHCEEALRILHFHATEIVTGSRGTKSFRPNDAVRKSMADILSDEAKAFDLLQSPHKAAELRSRAAVIKSALPPSDDLPDEGIIH